MAKKKRLHRRSTNVLLKKSEKKKIREFSKFVPALEKYKGKEKISSSAYGLFKKAEKKLRHTENLKPVTEKQAKKLGKKYLVGGGIRAIRLRNTSDKDAHTRVKTVRDDGVIITTNGRDWEYHPISVSNPGEVPEALIEKGRELFNRKKNPPWQIHLWTAKGRAGQGFTSFPAWARFVLKEYNSYTDPTEWMKGVAILTRDGKNGYRAEIKKKAKPLSAMKLKPKKEENDDLYYGDYDEEE